MLTCPDMAKEAVSELRAAGIEPTLDELASLFELARRIQEPVRRTSPWYEGTPVRAGANGPTLHPLTIQAEEWFDWIVSTFPDEKTRGIAFCYAADRGRDSDAFAKMWSAGEASRALSAYARGLACTRAELESAAMRIMEEPTPGDVLRSRKAEEDGGFGFDFGDIIARLVAVTGQPREYWLAQPRTYAFRVLEHAVNFAAQSSGMGSGGADNDPDYLRASFDFQAAEILIRERAANGRE